uniref:Mdh6 n=1 Tax=Arundo donax TaxID=35708 RepID=A0A0A9CYC9_ARUDO
MSSTAFLCEASVFFFFFCFACSSQAGTGGGTGGGRGGGGGGAKGVLRGVLHHLRSQGG